MDGSRLTQARNFFEEWISHNKHRSKKREQGGHRSDILTIGLHARVGDTGTKSAVRLIL